MENLIKALEEANKKIKEVLELQEEIQRDIQKIVGEDEFDQRDNKNEDSNLEPEQ